jgi:predicted GH43/DUF377 family glycosyl hydrolase
MSAKGFRRNIAWSRNKNNPVLPPIEGSNLGINVCMNPHVIRRKDEYYLYYAGDFADGKRKICLAKASIDNLNDWDRLGPLFENGSKGSFDSHWCVLPNLIQVDNNLWHMYYTGNNGCENGLEAFSGIGLAISKDGIHWDKYDKNPVIAASNIKGDPDAVGVAGGSVIKTVLNNGKTQYCYYYTGCPTYGEDYFLHQQKACCLAVSDNGISWVKKGVVLRRHPDHDYENVAAAGPVVMRDDDGLYRMWYSAIGTRWGYYSICYAESNDGINWYRGKRYGENLQMGPDLGPLTTGYHGVFWDTQMVAYPSVIKEGNKHRLFYTGNGYGRGGIGTAVSLPLRVEPTNENKCQVKIISHEFDKYWFISIPEILTCDEGFIIGEQKPDITWQGPDPDCNIWYEWEQKIENELSNCISRVRIRVILIHKDDGISIRFTIINNSNSVLHNIILRTLLSSSDNDTQVKVLWENSLKLHNNMKTNYSETMLSELRPQETDTLCGKIVLS